MNTEDRRTLQTAGEWVRGITIADFHPMDVEEYVKAFYRLSKRTILHRFNEPIKRLTPGQLRYLTHIDYINHYACCAFESIEGRKSGVGLARFVRIEKDSDIAEFAVTVTDENQGRGVGSMLFEYLRVESKERGVETLRGYVRFDNKPMLSLLRKYNHKALKREGNLLIIDIG